jgi:HD-GYP domain-containing protein (c-di-GMP phosphodiesterase class II)
MADVRTRADGGSAATQATDLDERTWTARPVMSFVIRATVLVAPIIGSFGMTYVYRAVVPAPVGLLETIAWWVGAIATVIVSMRWLEKIFRRLLPVAVMFKMSLVFPDQAPSRFKTALLTGTTRQLEREVAGGHPDDVHRSGSTTPVGGAQALLLLVARLSSHDRLTRGHCERVRGYTDLIAKEMGLPAEDRQKLHWAALIHDVGKLRIPPEILNRRRRPTDEEWEILKSHPAAGEDLVEPLRPWLGDWALATTQHHERWDGKGYPKGLAREEISLAGRIVAVADAYDVMTSTRSYKKPISPVQAKAELARNAGTQFDPAVVKAFLSVGLGRTRTVLGPIAWLTELPRLGQLTTTATSSVGGAVTTAATAAVVSVGSIMATGPPGESPTPALPVERVVSEPNEPPGSSELVGTTTTTPPPEPTTTTTPWVVATTPWVTATTPWVTTTTEPPVTTTTEPPVRTTTTTVVTLPPQASTTTIPPPITSTTTVPPATSTTTAPPPVGPNAVNDSATAPVNAILVDVLANDGENGYPIDSSTLAIVSGPTSGTASISSDRIRYHAQSGYSGPDQVTYQICDTGGFCSTAVLFITVEP